MSQDMIVRNMEFPFRFNFGKLQYGIYFDVNEVSRGNKAIPKPKQNSYGTRG